MPTEISGSTGVNKIQDGTVVNADINSSAAIDASKLTGIAQSIAIYTYKQNVNTAGGTMGLAVVGTLIHLIQKVLTLMVLELCQVI